MLNIPFYKLFHKIYSINYPTMTVRYLESNPGVFEFSNYTRYCEILLSDWLTLIT